MAGETPESSLTVSGPLHFPESCILENTPYTNPAARVPPGMATIARDVTLPAGRILVRAGIASAPLRISPSGITKWNERRRSRAGMPSRTPVLSARANETNEMVFPASRNPTTRRNQVQGPQSAS